MTDWKMRLRDADPMAPGGGEMPTIDAQRIRRVVLDGAAPGAGSPSRVPLRPLFVGGVVVLMIALGTSLGPRMEETTTRASAVGITGDRLPQTRQLQFSTPGGTRIIWVFNSEFNIPETTP